MALTYGLEYKTTKLVTKYDPNNKKDAAKIEELISYLNNLQYLNLITGWYNESKELTNFTVQGSKLNFKTNDPNITVEELVKFACLKHNIEPPKYLETLKLPNKLKVELSENNMGARLRNNNNVKAGLISLEKAIEAKQKNTYNPSIVNDDLPPLPTRKVPISQPKRSNLKDSYDRKNSFLIDEEKAKKQARQARLNATTPSALSRLGSGVWPVSNRPQPPTKHRGRKP